MDWTGVYGECLGGKRRCSHSRVEIVRFGSSLGGRQVELEVKLVLELATHLLFLSRTRPTILLDLSY